MANFRDSASHFLQILLECAPMNAPLPSHLLHTQDALADTDPQETAEWRDAFLALVATEGPERARHMLQELVRVARAQRIGWQPDLNTPYVNTVAVQDQPVFPGDLALEERVASMVRWNALAMVVRARPTCARAASTISSVHVRVWVKASTGATWCSSSPTARRACMPAHSSKGVCPKKTSCTTARS